MKIFKTIAALAVAATTLAGVASSASADSSSAPIWVTNNVPGRAAWISISTTGFGTNTLQRLCVLPGTSVQSDKINLYEYTNVYVRAEFKDYGNNCNTQHNRFDINNPLTMVTVDQSGRAMVSYYGNGTGRNEQQPTVGLGWH